MSPMAAALPYLAYAITLYLFPSLVLLSFSQGLYYARLRGLTVVAILCGLVLCVIGASLGSIVQPLDPFGWGSMTALILAAGCAETGYFLILAGGLFAKSMLSEACSCFATCLTLPLLYLFFWLNY